MFAFLSSRKDSKKSPSDKEVDGGFVFVGETVEESRRKMQSMHITQPSTNVIVLPSKPFSPGPAEPVETNVPAEAASSLPDLLGDIPFTLSPDVQAMQARLILNPDMLLSQDINYNLASFQYDFTLENSILQNV